MNTRFRLFSIYFLIGALVVAAGPAGAQPAEPGKIAIFTRTVKIFSQAEQVLDDAVRAHDEAALTKSLAADFEARQADNPAEPIPRAEWLTGAAPDANSQRNQMAVHDHGNLAIVSFLRVDPAADATQPAQQTFVIDVWKKADDNWQLLTRYESEPVQVNVPTQDVEPTGKG